MIKIDDFRTLSIGTNLANNDKPKNDDDVENVMLTCCCFLSSAYVVSPGHTSHTFFFSFFHLFFHSVSTFKGERSRTFQSNLEHLKMLYKLVYSRTTQVTIKLIK